MPINTSTSTAGIPEAWSALDNDRRLPSITMRFTELESTVLKHIAATTPFSMHSFCLLAIQHSLQKFIDEADAAKADLPAAPAVNCPSCQQKLLVVAA
jgi:hypothetical protein